MADKYKTVQQDVTAIQYTFDNLKEIYMWLGMNDVTYYVKSRVLSGVVTGKDGVKLNVQKEDYIVKQKDGTVLIVKPDVFAKEYVKVE